MKLEHAFLMVDGKEILDDEVAAAELLTEQVLFVSAQGPTLELYALCNDLFYWGAADAQEVPPGELESLFRMHRADSEWGSCKWCCLARNLRPQEPVLRDMKKAGVWDEAMEALPARDPKDGG